MSRTYDPSQVNLVLGITVLNNWDTIRIAYEEDQITHSAGTQGEVTRTLNANKLGTITVTCPQTSIDNGVFSNYAISKFVVPCTVLDLNGTGQLLGQVGATKVIMPMGSVVKLSDSELAKESGQREWTIRGKLDVYYVGSNTLDEAVDMGV